MKKGTSLASFVEPMLLLPTDVLPEAPEWFYEIKLDGYRALAIKTAGKLLLRSRNDRDFSLKYATIAEALRRLPDETIVDGELVAFDQGNKPSFNALQNFANASTPIYFYAFDLLMLAGVDLKSRPLYERRDLLIRNVLPRLKEPIRFSPQLESDLPSLICSVRTQGLEGLVAKDKNSTYQPGERSGAWLKMRINRGQEFVIGGYTPGTRNFDALVIGYYEAKQLMYVARTRNGFTPASRAQLFTRLRELQIAQCPFANLPQSGGRWGQGFTAAKMRDCRWLRPVLVAEFEFAEWTSDNHLRHSRFVALREDKSPEQVSRETTRR